MRPWGAGTSEPGLARRAIRPVDWPYDAPCLGEASGGSARPGRDCRHLASDHDGWLGSCSLCLCSRMVRSGYNRAILLSVL